MTDGIYLITPSCDDSFCGAYVAGVLGLSRACEKKEVPLVVARHTGSSHICMARNYCATRFLNSSDLSHMMFIDDDIGFNAEDVLALYNTGLDLVAGTYPRKSIDWDTAFDVLEKTGNRSAAKLSAFKYTGLADEKEDGAVTFLPELGCMETGHLATGFMMVSREALETIMKAHPEGEFSDGYNFFGYGNLEPSDDPSKRQMLGEDYYFTQLAKKSGLKTYMYLKAKLDHYGSAKYEGYAWNAVNK